jgi:hypothetical protein
VIHHIDRATMEATATPEQIEAALESRRAQGRSNPAVKSFIVGRDHGGDYDDDPDLNAKIREPHRRRNELNPEVAGMPAAVPAYTGSGVDD